MAFSTDQFRLHFSRHLDFAKTSRFEVRISTPNGLGIDARDLRFQCETTELPGYNLNTVEGRYYGVPQPVASVASFADITLTFICAGDLWEKKFFDQWMNYIAPINNYNLSYKDSYVSPKIEILQYPEGIDSESGQANPDSVRPVYTVSLFNAFPVSIGGMQLNWSDDSIHRLAVVFKYDYWTTGELEGANRGLKDYQKQGNAKPSGSTPPAVDGKSTSQRTTQRPPRGRTI
jgi:hypothetical protein